MHFVDPIRDKRKITQIKNLMEYRGKFRDLLLFTIGINSALRISDLIDLRVGQILDRTIQTCGGFAIHDKKTGKLNRVPINQAISTAAMLYAGAYPAFVQVPGNFLFFQQRGSSRNPTRHLTEHGAWYLIHTICKEVGLPGNYGTHTLRKTWAYQARKAGVPIETIMHKLNHANFAETRRYIGITDDEIKEAVEGLNL